MKRTNISELFANPHDYENKAITVCGFARTIRDSKHFGFIELNDGSCLNSIQIVLEQEKLDNFSQIIKQHVGCALVVQGNLVLTPNAQQPFEIMAVSIEIEGVSSPAYPLQKKRHSLEYLRSIAHLRPRTNTFNAAFRLRSEISYAIHEFFHNRGFVYVHTPIITGSDAEGAGEMFRVSTLPGINPPLTEDNLVDYSRDFFEKQTHLTVSGQLEAEVFALSFCKTYTFGPTFRAENSNTARHAAEFWMIEPEIAFADLSDDMDLAEDMIKYLVDYALKHCSQEMEFFNRFMDNTLIQRLNEILGANFERLTYTRAIEILEKHKDKFEYPVVWGCDLQTEHERFLTEQVMQRPVFVTDYPKEIKAFYMRLNDDNKTVAATDLLVPGVGEIIGGSQREERLDILTKRMKESDLKEEDYWWYLDLRRFGGTKHAGFGLGLERFLMYLSGIGNIRDIIPFPRTPGCAEF